MKLIIRYLVTLLSAFTLNSYAELILPVVEGQIVSNLIEIKEKTFFQEKIRANIQLPSGDWNVRHIQKAFSTHGTQQEGKAIWFDKVVDNNISEVFFIELYETNSQNWNISCSTGILQKLNVGGLNTDCFSVNMTKFMGCNTCKQQVEVRRKWAERGIVWSTNQLNYTGVFQRNRYGNAYVFYAIPTKQLGVADVDLIQNSKLHDKNINQNISKDEVDKLQSWYRKFHENITESIYSYDQKEFASKVETIESPYRFLLDVFSNKFSSYKVEPSPVKPQAKLSEEESKRKQTELDEQLRLAQQQARPITAVTSSPMTNMANRRALVIGNDTYKSVAKLLNAREDARTMASNLTSVGYQVTLKLDLNEKEMKAAMRTFANQVEGGDEVLFFFAGHGVQLGATNYLLPTDIGGESEAQVRDEAIQLQRVLDDMSERKAKFTLAMIDACRDNPFKSSGRAIGGRGLAPTTAATGQMVIFSAGTGQQALDKLNNADKNKNGLFTRVFVQEMQKPSQSIDRVVKNVRNQVAELAKSVGHEQVPAIYDQVLGDFYFKK